MLQPFFLRKKPNKSTITHRKENLLQETPEVRAPLADVRYIFYFFLLAQG